MIPGDIDLTENLDFRNVRRRETPQLPAVWKGNNRNNVLNSDDITYFTANSTISTTLSSTSSIQYNNIDNFEMFETELWEPEESYNVRSITATRNSLNNWNVSVEYNASIEFNTISTVSGTFNTITNNTYYSLYYDDNNTHYIDTTLYSPKMKKKEYDVFGNIKKTDDTYIPKIPWDREIVYSSSRIPWNKKRQEVIPVIPRDWWDDIINNTSVFDKDGWIRLSDNKFSKIKNLISWLSDKSRSFIENYLDSSDNEDNLSYLTNMNHIRIKDAIID